MTTQKWIKALKAHEYNLMRFFKKGYNESVILNEIMDKWKKEKNIVSTWCWFVLFSLNTSGLITYFVYSDYNCLIKGKNAWNPKPQMKYITNSRRFIIRMAIKFRYKILYIYYCFNYHFSLIELLL